jgi:hypothetical protein
MMPIHQDLLKEIECCLSNDRHIVSEPVLFECGENACKNCVNSLKENSNKCYSCDKNHDKKELLNAPFNKLAETIIKINLKDIFELIGEKVRTTIESLQGF